MNDQSLIAPVHEALIRALAEAGVRNEVLLGMAIEVGLEAFVTALAREQEAQPAPTCCRSVPCKHPGVGPCDMPAQPAPAGPSTSADRYFYEAGFKAGRAAQPAPSDDYQKGFADGAGIYRASAAKAITENELIHAANKGYAKGLSDGKALGAAQPAAQEPITTIEVRTAANGTKTMGYPYGGGDWDKLPDGLHPLYAVPTAQPATQKPSWVDVVAWLRTNTNEFGAAERIETRFTLPAAQEPSATQKPC